MLKLSTETGGFTNGRRTVSQCKPTGLLQRVRQRGRRAISLNLQICYFSATLSWCEKQAAEREWSQVTRGAYVNSDGNGGAVYRDFQQTVPGPLIPIPDNDRMQTQRRRRKIGY